MIVLRPNIKPVTTDIVFYVIFVESSRNIRMTLTLHTWRTRTFLVCFDSKSIKPYFCYSFSRQDKTFDKTLSFKETSHNSRDFLFGPPGV